MGQRKATTQRARELREPFGPAKRRIVLDSLALKPNLARAARLANVNRTTIWKTRQRDSEFDAACKEAIEEGAENLEAEAMDHAVDGVEDYVVHDGEVVFVWVDAEGKVVPIGSKGADKQVPLVKRRYSDTVLITLLKAHMREKYREQLNVQHAGGVHILELPPKKDKAE